VTFASLLELLDPAVTFRSDGGGLIIAARQIFTGPERVARIFTRFANHFGEQFRLSPIAVNGTAGLLLDTAGSPSAIAFTLKLRPDHRHRRHP
jgi:RNA polymerase sigma-70 factor (ECF subfamily)